MPLLLFGHSWGGYAVATVLHFEHDIAGVVTISGPNSPLEMVMEQGRQMLGPIINTQRPFLWLYQRFLYGEIASLNAVEAINSSTVPVLIIHGNEDGTVTFNGSALFAKFDQITNPNVEVLVADEEGRSGHNNLFRSSAAIAYIAPLNAEYAEVFHHYAGDIPVDVRRSFYAKVDRKASQELDPGLMDTINDFFLRYL